MDTLTDRLAKAKAAHDRAQQTERAKKADLDAAIVAALDGGVRQVDVVRMTGLTRERIRQIHVAARERAASGGAPSE